MSERRATTRFSDRAGAYSSHRPGYPPEVFDALFDGLGDPRELTVADVGAGTGISTQPLAERVRRVVAVEPNARMRERALELPNVAWQHGTAEQTGLESKSVHLAAAFQAFHWFDPQAAFAEFARVAKLRIALVQYERDESAPFSLAYAQTIRPYMLDDTEALRIRTLERFAALAAQGLRRTVVPSSQTLTLDGLLGRAASSSYLPQEGERAEDLRADLRELFAGFQREGRVEMAMSIFVLAADVQQ